jgi:hypothetical protein
MIKYPFLGYGNITFFVEDQDSSRFILMHTIKYTNSSTEIQVSNPNLDFMAKVVNSGNTTNKTLYVGSIGVFSSGERLFISNPKWATDNVKTGVTAETNLFTLRNATTFNGVRNKGLIRPNTISIGSASAGGTPTSCVLRFRLDGTVGGVPAFTPINGSTADNGVTITNGNSFTSADTAGTTSTGGLVIFNVALISQSTQIIDLSNYNIFIPPGSRLTLGCFASGNTAFSVGITWTEDF